MDATPIKGASRARPRCAASRRGGVIIGPQYARLAGLEVGDRVSLRGPGGARERRSRACSTASPTWAATRCRCRWTRCGASTASPATRSSPSARARTPRPGRWSGASKRSSRTTIPGVELASVVDKKEEVRDQVSATFNMFNSIVAIAVIVSLLGVVNALAMSVLRAHARDRRAARPRILALADPPHDARREPAHLRGRRHHRRGVRTRDRRGLAARVRQGDAGP